MVQATTEAELLCGTADGKTVQALWGHRPSGGGLVGCSRDAVRGQQHRPRQGFPGDCNNSVPMQQQKLWPFVGLWQRPCQQQHSADHGENEGSQDDRGCLHDHFFLEPSWDWEKKK